MLGLVAAFTPSLFAFAPDGDVYIGVEPQRIHDLHAGAQRALARDPEWLAFTQGEGSGWMARFDERTGQPHRMWGPGIPMGALATASDAERAVRDVLTRWSGLVGAQGKDLPLRSANYVASTDTWYVELDRLVDGVPVWRGGVTARIKHGNLVLLGLDTYPSAPRLGQPTLPAADAIRRARDQGPASWASHSGEAARLVLLPLDRASGLEWHLAWEVRSTTADPPGKWVSFVDAQDGALLSVHNEVRFFSGTLYGTHDTRTVDGSFSTSVMPHATIAGSGGTRVTTAADGSFTAGDGESWTGQLRGSWLTVTNQDGAEGTLSVSGASPTWTDEDATQAEIDTWIFLHQVYDWVGVFNPDLGMIDDGLTSNVNLASTCNAYYDGTVNFYVAGDGCNNTGRIGDVAYHEWGHGFHYYSLVAGSWDGTMGEAIGDSVAMLQTLDPEIAPYFWTDGSPIRDISVLYTYPDDVYGEVHQDGLIFGGAFYDLLLELQDTYGEGPTEFGEAWTVAGTLLAEAIKGGPTLETVYDEFVLADDDDGDLGNGTPHLCEIVVAFERHGIGASGGTSLLSIDHEALGNQGPDAAIPVSATVANFASACVDAEPEEAEIAWSIDGGESWETASLDLSGDVISGELPAFSAGTVVQYYLVVRDGDGNETTQPASWAPYTFYVGDLTEIWCEDFSAGEGGFTHASGSGTDPWAFGVPTGLSGDPTGAYSDENVWGTDLGISGDGDYPSQSSSTLTGPAVDLGGESRVVVQYRRWLTVEDGIYDVATLSANGEAIWENHGSSRSRGDEHTQDTEWMLHTVVVDTDGTSLQLAWGIESDQGLELGGWNLDDVCVYAPNDPNAWFSVGDFVASDDRMGEVQLSWTQPDDARATDVVVVRRDDRYPTNAEDGRVVYTGTDIPAGEAVTARDPLVGDAYYTVFVGGDAGWTTGSVEGANSDMGLGLDEDGLPGDGGPGAEDDAIEISKGGCGCAAPAGGGASVLAGLLALVAVGRRRR